MKDSVTYVLLFGLLCKIANTLFVNEKVLEIFRYRKEVLLNMFGPSVNEEGKPEYFILDKQQVK